MERHLEDDTEEEDNQECGCIQQEGGCICPGINSKCLLLFLFSSGYHYRVESGFPEVHSFSGVKATEGLGCGKCPQSLSSR